jgi:hypothetical protein
VRYNQVASSVPERLGTPADAASRNASCQIHRDCPAPRTLPFCDADDKYARSWTELQFHADMLVGRPVVVAGYLANDSSLTSSNRAPCAPGMCCHALHFTMSLGRPGEPRSSSWFTSARAARPSRRSPRRTPKSRAPWSANWADFGVAVRVQCSASRDAEGCAEIRRAARPSKT